jgi:hypothetical protein
MALAIRLLRERKGQTPILMVTARDAVHDISSGLDGGADNWMPSTGCDGRNVRRSTGLAIALYKSRDASKSILTLLKSRLRLGSPHLAANQ